MSSADIPIRGGGRREGGGGQRGRGGRGGGGQRGREGRGGGGQRGRGRGRGEYTPSPSSYRPRSYSSSAASSAASSAPPASSSLYRDSSVAAAAVSLGRLSVQEQAAAAQTSEPTVHAITARRPTYDEASFPTRPGFGKEGDKCWVRANHFLVSLTKEISVYHYDVSISPEVISARVNRAVINQLVNLYGKSYLGDKFPGYDGKKSLYTAGSLPFESKEFVIKLGDDGKKRNAQRREREFKVVIKFANRVDLHHLNKFLSGVQMDLPQEVLQALDVVMRESRSIKYVTVGRSFFAPELGEKSSLGDGLECWKGFHQSIRPTQMGLSLNIDVSATSFYEPIPVIEYVTKLLNVRDQSRPLSDSDRVKVKKVLRGVKVVDTHRKNSCGQYRVSGITSVPTSQLMFPDENGHTVSVVQYFWKKYSIRLQYVTWPSLQAGTDKRPIYLPMEVCTIVEGQRYSKKLNENQVTAILKASCQRPHDRERNVKEIVGYNNYSEDDFAKEFGIEVKAELASIGARVLQPPVLKYHPSSLEDHCRPQVGQWNMINKKVVAGGKVENWTCLNLSRTNQHGVVSFCWQLVDFCRDIGMDFATDSLIPIRSCHPNQIDDVLRDISSQCTAKLENMQVEHKHLQLLIVILPEGRDTYGRIKRICETELGIVTQCCKPRHILRPNRQYLGNLALKINVKVGGRNTVLCDAITRRISLVTDVPTIIFGADVTHPQPGEDSSPSIAAVVASMDWPEITKYRALVSSQPHRRELIDDLFIEGGAKYQGMIRDHLMAFYRSTQQRPHRIIFFRDGVSEGQFSQVLLNEIEAIRKACKSLQEDYVPRVTFVVVQKRHHTRFFPTNPNFTDRSGNIKPGTVIDTMICHPTEFDFYLCSHAGIQGTSRPTHYHVLFDENNFTADEMQKLTYSLCYTYARCTRSVSVVPPAYYAHLAAFRARYYLDDASDNGSTIGGGINRELNAAVRPLPELKEVVKDVMFYC